jgi:hypothetical protein
LASLAVGRNGGTHGHQDSDYRQHSNRLGRPWINHNVVIYSQTAFGVSWLLDAARREPTGGSNMMLKIMLVATVTGLLVRLGARAPWDDNFAVAIEGPILGHNKRGRKS